MQPRIVTLTLNPAVDIACDAKAVMPVRKVHTFGETHDPGGGGVNVARVVHELGGNVVAVVLVGGVTGRFLVELMAEAGVPCRAVPIADRTRICMTVHNHASGQEYRFVAEGPEVSAAELDAGLAAVEAESGDWLVASGSLPRGVPVDTYVRVAQLAARRGQHFVVDTSGPALKAVLGHGLALIKPSIGEFETLVGGPLRRAGEQNAAALNLVRSGAAERVAVSLGHRGALLATAEGVWRQPAPDVHAVGAVGAGDSFLAAMTLALARGCDAPDALAWGSAGGAAAVMHTGTAHPNRAEVEELYLRMREMCVSA
jgi:6-phosphofructokinase 2